MTFIKGREFFDQKNDHQRVKKNSFFMDLHRALKMFLLCSRSY
jgi:hypothetical protein